MFRRPSFSSFAPLLLIIASLVRTNSGSEFRNVKLVKPSDVLHKQYDSQSSGLDSEYESSTTENYSDARVQLFGTAAPAPALAIVSKSTGTSTSTSSRVLGPLGAWSSAKNVLKNGIHRFRESLHEGVKVAQMLKEDVDEGVSQLLPKVPANGNGPKTPSRKSRKENGNLNETVAISEENNVSQASVNQPLWDLLSKITEFEGNQAEEFGKFGYQLPRQGVLGGILKFMGVDSSSIGIILLNILIFVAEMVTSTMLGKDANSIADTRMLKENLYEWVLTGKNDQVSHLIDEAQSPELPNHLIQMLRRRSGSRTSCIQLLVCKMSPFIKGIQQTAKQEYQIYHANGTASEQEGRATSGVDSYFSAQYLEFIWSQLVQLVPDKKKFLSLGDSCEKQYPTCKLLKYSPPKLEKGKLISQIKA